MMGMETIYDVLRFLVNSARSSAAEQDIVQALAVITEHEAGGGMAQPSPDATPADGLPQQGGF